MDDVTYISMQLELVTYLCAAVFICVALIVFKLFLIIKQNKKIMSNQSRLEAANEKTTAAIAGIGRDFQAFVEEVRAAQGGNVSEETIAKAEENANLLAGLDAQKEDAPEEEPTQEETPEDPTAPNTGGGQEGTEEA